jgi:predicted RNA-binding Zn-ribbon protein involved in translation (DUF1610 family)
MVPRRLRVLWPAILIGAVVVLAAGAGEEGACDLKTVVPGFYCENCDEALVAKDLVSDVVYYACPDCGEISREPGRCSWCDTDLVKKTSGKDVCKTCLEKPTKAELCEKVYYVCPDCGAMSLKAGTCEECETDMEKKVSRAVVHYVCPECGDFQLSPGNCTNPSCEHEGKALVRTCSLSGEFPHGGSE